MRLIPDSHGLREYNHCHAPAGSPDGGQFCSGGSTARDETPSYGSSPHADTLRTLVTAMGYRAKEGRTVIFSNTSNRGPSAHRLPEGVTLAQVKKAIAATPVVDGWRFTYIEPEVVKSKGGMGASKAGIRVDSNKRAKYLGAKVKVERDTATAKDDTPTYGGRTEKDINEWTVSDNVGEFLDTITGWGYPNPIGTRDTWVFDDSRIVMDVIPKKEGKDWYIYLTGFQSIGGQGKGRGSAFLKRVTDLADEHKVTLRLMAEPLPVRKPMKKTPRERLTNFYKRHGFTRDVDKAGRMFGAGSMIRRPA